LSLDWQIADIRQRIWRHPRISVDVSSLWEQKMKTLFISLAAVAALGASMAVYAQAPAGAPAGSTGLCKDGSYYSGPTKKGACAGHKGVKDWYGAMAPAAAAGAAARTGCRHGSFARRSRGRQYPGHEGGRNAGAGRGGASLGQ
jgi:hypothetical protein